MQEKSETREIGKLVVGALSITAELDRVCELLLLLDGWDRTTSHSDPPSRNPRK